MNNKEQKIAGFDPNGVGDVSGGLFGLPFNVDEAEVVIVPVPWEVTVSYSAGTAQGPRAVKDASPQLDLFDPNIKDAWKLGLAMEEIPYVWENASEELRKKAEEYITWLEAGSPEHDKAKFESLATEVTTKGEELLQWLKQKALTLMEKGKLVGVLGGDHSTPLGLMHALAEKHEEYGILQVDAHADLRNAYEGFEYSHASIMYNALKLPQVKKLVQVGIRDLAESEAEMADQSNGRITVFYDAVLKENMYEGDSWKKQCKKIIAQLPQKVYISFDIDGLDPKLCPATGTPVPGGLEFEQAVYLIKQLVKSGREIVGFDLCEVAPGDSEWNGNVGARMLYKLCNWMAVSQKRLEAQF
ncbi:agmatinase family protein [Pontibacter silvestris]|uniref:Agmatinase family protein n=1 Tax=Pontibacter silvestris TaxID=2305183 RepID=A0ABW4WZK3_9BACT|nr:agmatinase family protein [Pontibacter silvestris]MCC9135204.1 agmatinase family protein [Pontibacter silvestris]